MKTNRIRLSMDIDAQTKADLRFIGKKLRSGSLTETIRRLAAEVKYFMETGNGGNLRR